MLSKTNSPTPTLVSVNGGRFNSAKSTWSTESKSKTEEIAVVEDSQAPKSLLMINSVVTFKEALKMENGTKSNAQNQSSEAK
jgi:hypothetical protein